MFQNANLSVRVTDEFMTAVEKDGPWNTIAVTTGEKCETYRARELMDLIAEGTRLCGDPGLQYHTTINKWHTCPNAGPINASNPCSEYMFINNSACNLASLNLMKFRNEDGSFNVETFKRAIRIYIIAQDILVDNGSYPEPLITENSHKYRPLGLGYANLGCLMMSLALPYDSDQARTWASAITAIMTGTAYSVSAEMAASRGTFDGYEANPEYAMRVLAAAANAERHRHAPRARPQHPRDALPGLPAQRRQGRLGRRLRRRRSARLPQRPDHRPGPHRHHRLHDGLRHHRRRARYRAGQVQTAGRRRHAQAGQPHRTDGP
jgi:ribonucleoside-diphosphate reductase alpha chain